MNQTECHLKDIAKYFDPPNLHSITWTSVCATVLTTFTILANVMVVVAMFLSRDKVSSHNDHDITKLLMASMACTDLIFALFHMPFSILQLIYNGKWILATTFCNIWLSIGNDLCGITACHILCIAVDKYLAVCKPLVYRTLSRRIGRVMILVSWVVPSCVFLLPLVTDLYLRGNEDLIKCRDKLMICGSMYNKKVLIAVFVMAFYLPMCATYLLYGRIFFEVWKFNKRKEKGKELLQTKIFRIETSAIHRKFQPENTISLLDLNVKNTFEARDIKDVKSSRTILRNLKAIRTLGAIVLCFTICWIPLLVFVVVFVFRDFELPMWSMSVVIWLSYLNSAINPVLYNFFKPVRIALKMLLCGLK